MLTDQQLFDLADAMEYKLERVCFKDELCEKPLKFNVGYIINLEDSMDKEGNDNQGTHWVALQVNKYPSNLIEPIYFDSYGAPPAEAIKKFVEKGIGKSYLPYTDSDIQALMNSACGWYCSAFLYWINKFDGRSQDLYSDTEAFIELFDDLNKSNNFKKNEFILKHFFRSKDPNKRVAIDVSADIHSIEGENLEGTKIPAVMQEVFPNA